MYAKIFNQIFDSSIADHWMFRHVFMDLLVLADKDGIVDMTHEAIACRTRIPMKIIREAIKFLEAPDYKSRTPDDDGARIRRLDDHREWGWVINNYDRFREIATEHDRREKTAARVRRHREKIRKPQQKGGCNAPVTLRNAHVTPVSASVSVSGTNITPSKAVILDKELDRVLKRINTLRSIYSGLNSKWEKHHKEEIQNLKKRRDEIKQLLEIKY